MYFLFCLPKKLSNKQKKIINLAFSTNNKYIEFLFTSLYSLLENSNINTVYFIFIQIGEEFEENNKKLINGLEKLYMNCFIYFLDMKSDFNSVFSIYIHYSTYYRLKLPILCPKINRIIYIDTDSLILKDLMELFTLDFEQKYILGRLDKIVDELDSLGKYTKTYINCGILLIDLYSLRKYNYYNKFMDYLDKYNNTKGYLKNQDQTLINYVCQDKIGLLDPKYHMWPFRNEEEIRGFNNRLRTKYNIEDLIKDFKDPFIVHYAGGGKNMKQDTIYHRKYHQYLNDSKKIKNIIQNINF